MNECGVFVDPKNIDLTPVCVHAREVIKIAVEQAGWGLLVGVVWKVMQETWLQTMCRIKGIGIFKWRSKVARATWEEADPEFRNA